MTPNDFPCPACGLVDYRLVVTRRVSAVISPRECLGCGLVYLENPPVPQPLGLKDTIPVLESFSPFMQWIKAQVILKPEVRTFRPYLERGGPILDIGSGTGWAAAFWRDFAGVEVHGLEVEPAWADQASQRYGLRILRGRFEEVSLPEETYRLIIMRHVFEHFHDPGAVLAKAHRVLKPGGHVLIIVPNGDGLGRRIFGQYWAWTLPYHINTFTPKAIRRILQTHGFTPLRLLHSPSPVMLSASVKNWLQCPGYIRLAEMLDEGSILLNCLLFPVSVVGKLVRHSEVITVLARKKGEESDSTQGLSSDMQRDKP